MKDDTKKKSADKPQPKSKSEQTTTTVFPLERLRKDCYTLFGVTTSTFDGATYGLNGEHSVESLKKVIAKWQSTQVCPAKKEAK
jgi:hypothetical protein